MRQVSVPRRRGRPVPDSGGRANYARCLQVGHAVRLALSRSCLRCGVAAASVGVDVAADAVPSQWPVPAVRSTGRRRAHTRRHRKEDHVRSTDAGGIGRRLLDPRSAVLQRQDPRGRLRKLVTAVPEPSTTSSKGRSATRGVSWDRAGAGGTLGASRLWPRVRSASCLIWHACGTTGANHEGGWAGERQIGHSVRAWRGS